LVSARTCVRDGGGPSIKNKDYVWSYDFVMDRTEDARRPKILPILDEGGVWSPAREWGGSGEPTYDLPDGERGYQPCLLPDGEGSSVQQGLRSASP
jgi:hypothetical protein